jgi:hypothetical protein
MTNIHSTIVRIIINDLFPSVDTVKCGSYGSGSAEMRVNHGGSTEELQANAGIG